MTVKLVLSWGSKARALQVAEEGLHKDVRSRRCEILETILTVVFQFGSLLLMVVTWHLILQSLEKCLPLLRTSKDRNSFQTLSSE
jgi:hypothetical protein